LLVKHVSWLNIVEFNWLNNPLSPDLRQIVSGPWRVRLHPGGEASFHRVALPTGFLIGPVDAVDGFRYGKMVNLWKTYGFFLGKFWDHWDHLLKGVTNLGKLPANFAGSDMYVGLLAQL